MMANVVKIFDSIKAYRILKNKIKRLKERKEFINIDEFLALKNKIIGALDLISELRIMGEDKICTLYQELDQTRFY